MMNEPQLIAPTVNDEIRAYSLIEDAIVHAERDLSSLKDGLRDAEGRVIAAFRSDPLQGPVEYNGRKWKVDDVNTVGVVDGQQDRVVEWIKMSGGESLIKPAMHWSSRDKFLRERLVDDSGTVSIPEELAGAVERKEFTKLTTRAVPR